MRREEEKAQGQQDKRGEELQNESGDKQEQRAEKEGGDGEGTWWNPSPRGPGSHRNRDFNGLTSATKQLKTTEDTQRCVTSC